MGVWTQERHFELYATLNDETKEETDRDEADWDELRHRLEMIAREHRYEHLKIVII